MNSKHPGAGSPDRPERMSGGSVDRATRGAALRVARVSAGLTQQQLGDFAELSIRAVRALETGATALPRYRSMVRIATTLGLDGAERFDFLQQWGHADIKVGGEGAVLYPPLPDVAALRDALRVRVASIETLALIVCDHVGADRQISWREVRHVAQARKDGVCGAIHLTEAVSEIDLDLLEMTDLQSCRLVRRKTYESVRTRMFEVDFGVSLDRGESHTYGYRVDYRGAIREPGPDGPGDDRVGYDSGGFGAIRPIPVYSYEVQFDPADLPTRCVRIRRPRVDGRVSEMDSVPLTPWSSAQLTLRDVRSGYQGLRWYWV